MAQRFLLTVCALTLIGINACLAQDCPVDIPDADRRDCHPWTDSSQAACEARGCLWCQSQQPNYPWCFINDKVCPSLIPEAARVDCMPEGGSRPDCLAKGCIWCDASSLAYAHCFADPTVSLGGQICPANIPVNERIDCHPEPGSTAAACAARGCYWCDNSPAGGEPWCYQPPQQGYRVQGAIMDTAKGFTATLTRVNTPSWYGADADTIRVDVEFHTDTRLRVKFSDSNKQRFEVPLAIDSPPGKAQNSLYDVEFVTNPVFAIKVIRKSTQAVIFDSSIGGLIFSDQFLQIATRLNSNNVYGFGEHEHHTLRHDMNWKTWGMYARDQAVTDSNLYGVHPFYMNLEQSANAHGVLFLNSNAQEVKLMPAPALTYRTIGGVLDIYFFLGPSPDAVVQQYNTAIKPPLMIPYWALGFQLCRWGYQNLAEMQAAVGRMRAYNIPHDVQYGDIDYMDGKRDFTIDPVGFGGLPAYIQQLKQEGTRFVIILDPAIHNRDTAGSYPTLDEGNRLDVWTKGPDGQTPEEGEVWPGPVYYPDFTKPATQTWWTQECINFMGRLEYAGLWIDMNEPSNFIDGRTGGCADNQWNRPPYIPAILGGSLWEKTVCADCKQIGGDMYNIHNLFGWNMAKMSLPYETVLFKARPSYFLLEGNSKAKWCSTGHRTYYCDLDICYFKT